VAALGETYGRGAMTNHWIDIKNSDVIMIIGSNAAENHPIAFKWVTDAMWNFQRGPSGGGAKLIVVDPRYTRTASKASYVDDGSGGKIQLYSKIRSGTDIAFMNGMIKYAIDNNRVNMQYIKDCTNASFLLDPNFKTCETSNPRYGAGGVNEGNFTGIFSGLEDDPRRHKKYKYNKTSSGTNPGYWSYQYGPNAPTSGTKTPLVDLTLADPNCVWQRFQDHLNRYTIAEVSNITGADPAIIEKIYEVYTSTYSDNKSACIMYAMGGTQHTYGSQNIRAYAMMQLILGNVGVAGGGINALRGESNVQGSTDMCLLWHILPGYLNVTTNNTNNKDRAAYKVAYTTAHTPQDPTPDSGPVSLAWWKNAPKYIDSLLQAWWPLEHTGHANLDAAYHYLPKADKDLWYTHE
jgi:formate dehydrogenase major subunit